MGEESDPLRILQEIEIWPYYQIIYAQNPSLKNEKHKTLWDFELQTDHPIPAKRPDIVRINKKKKKENLSTRRTTEWKSKKTKTENDREKERIL